MAWLLAWPGVPGLASARPLAPTQDDYACTGADADGLPLSTRSVDPPRVALCEQARVETRVRAACAPPPLSVVLNVDRSGSMYGQPIRDVMAAGHALLDALELPGSPDTRVALISHGDPAQVDVPFGADEVALRAGLDRLAVASEAVPDNLPGAIDLARQLFEADRAGLGHAPVEVMVVLSDGGQTFAAPQVLAAAARARGAGLLVAAICVQNRLASCPTMAAIASRSELSFEVQGSDRLPQVFEAVARGARAVAAREILLTERLPAGLGYVAGSARPEAMVDPRAGTLSWRLQFVPREGMTVSYAVAPRWTGRFELPAPEARLSDPLNRELMLPVPAAELTVEGTCGLETATPSPEPSVTPRPSPTASATPPPTATREPRPLYLPLLFRTQCLTRERPADVVLLIDASNSMGEATTAGRSKLAAVQEGARRFVTQLRPQDRAAVIAFNDRAELKSGLTSDPAALDAAITSIATAPGTRIDVALYAAALELAGPGRRPDSRGLIVLMTDGRPSPETREAALSAAAGARAAGHLLFAIGVGADADLALLRAAAGDPGRTFAVEDAEAVAAIYREIAERIPCR